ncbi:MAG: sugar phosphate nucleotidyltransferase [Dehalococcoidia bacterium]|jgi:NDP-sugar pyrophosphorylase family protein
MMPVVALLAGGYASRLYPVTKTIPKAMLTVAGRPFIAHQLALLKKNGITKVVICSGYLSKQIEDFVGDGKEFGLSIDYSSDGRKLLGTGGAIKKALPLLGDVFFIIYGDSYLTIDFKAVYDFFLSQNKKGLMTLLRNRDEWDSSNIIFRNGKIINYEKTERIEDMEFVDYGLSILKQSAFDDAGNTVVFDLAVIYKSLIVKDQMAGYEVKRRFYEIGSARGLAETEGYLLNLSRENGGACS